MGIELALRVDRVEWLAAEQGCRVRNIVDGRTMVRYVHRVRDDLVLLHIATLAPPTGHAVEVGTDLKFPGERRLVRGIGINPFDARLGLNVWHAHRIVR